MNVRSLFSAFAAASFFLCTLAADRNLLPDSAEDAWKEVENAAKPPPYPAEWGSKPPTPEQREQFQQTLGNKSAEAAMKAREFYERFPDHAKVQSAKEQEKQFVQRALNFGATNLPSALEQALPEEERLKIKVNTINRRAMAKQPQGTAAVMNELEAGIRELMKQHPKSSALWTHLMIVAQNTPDREHQKKLLDEVTASPVADEEAKARAKGMLRLLGAVGRPLEMSFTATDGSTVDVQKMKGKVVLIDFWAAWCGPCIQSLPELVRTYGEYHEKGLEILGINMDKNRRDMEATIERFEMPWRQYFDGRGWGNKFALEYNVTAIPSMWLVDKKGILRTMQARENLEGQIKELLAESDAVNSGQ